MSKAATLRAQLTAAVQATPLPMLIEATDKLDAKPSRDEAESRVMVELAVELGKRLRSMAREHATEALMLDLIDMMKVDNATRPRSRQMSFSAIGDILEERFPVAAEAAGDWLDEADFDNCNPDGYDYHRYLLTQIEAERVAA